MEIDIRAVMKSEEEKQLVEDIIAYVKTHIIADTLKEIKFRRQIKVFGSRGVSAVNYGVYRNTKKGCLNINLARLGAGGAAGKHTCVGINQFKKVYGPQLTKLFVWYCEKYGKTAPVQGPVVF